jgi:mono/diheme cytochrome c family protein
MHRAQRALALLALLWCGAADPDPQNFGQIERGKYLAAVGDCVACHTAKGGQPFAGGLPVHTPFGIVVSPNITPDRETGVGAWSEEDFLRVMQRGIAPHGVHLYPAMPYTDYTHVTQDDDLAIWAWLKTLPAVSNKVVADQLAFPLSIRATMIAWNALFFRAGVFQPDPAQSVMWNRGAYLVTGLGHCGACHTPRNFLGAEKSSADLAGAPVEGWFAPNITSDPRHGVGGWAASEIVEYLRGGHNVAAAASGPMGQEVALSSAHMTDTDLQAIAIYLKDVPATTDTASAAPPDGAVMKEGGAIYADECSACHTPDGKGIAQLFPALAAAPSIQAREATSVIRVILQGAKSVATDRAPTGPAMPTFGWMLTDQQIAAVSTYIRNAWGNAAPVVSDDEVRHERDRLARSGGE